MIAAPHSATRLAAGSLFAAALALAGPAMAQAPTQAEVDAGLELYTARLSYAIARFRTNPPEGIGRYTEGIVQLRININADGQLEGQALLKSSGNPLLDQHARNILQSAVPQTGIPSGLHKRAFYIDVTIDFSS
ncbi:MAG: TonB family protein [Betaproteobacteria bacterium]